MKLKLKIVLMCLVVLLCTLYIGGLYLTRDINDDVIPLSLNRIINNETRYGYIKGDYKNEFGKGSYLTRAEISCMIFEIENLSYGYDKVFNDTKDNAYVGIISSVVKNGYMNGVSKDEFMPDNYITRGDFANVIINIVRHNKSIELKKLKNYDKNFDDIDKMKNKTNIIKLYEYGLVNDTNNKFRPNDFLQKEEAIVILNKLYGYNNGDILEMIDVYNKNPYSDINDNYWAYEDIVRATVGLEYKTE